MKFIVNILRWLKPISKRYLLERIAQLEYELDCTNGNATDAEARLDDIEHQVELAIEKFETAIDDHGERLDAVEYLAEDTKEAVSGHETEIVDLKQQVETLIMINNAQ